MAEHNYNFEGGDELRKMGARWFIIYSFYCYKNKFHKGRRGVGSGFLTILKACL
jgi:hypothetical protein